MKTLIVLFCIVFACVVYAEPPEPEKAKPENTTGIPQEVIDKCPTKGMIENCTMCHTTPSFMVKEGVMFEEKDPPYGCSYRIDTDGQVVGYYELTDINPAKLQEFLEYFAQDVSIKKLIINVFSPGGSVFHAWKAIAQVERFKGRFLIETRCDAAAFSAGFLFFLVGEERLVAPNANLMAHQVQSWSFFDNKTPASLVEEAEIFRKWQLQIDEWIASKSNVTAEFVAGKTKFKEWWISGTEAVEEYKMATGYIK